MKRKRKTVLFFVALFYAIGAWNVLLVVLRWFNDYSNKKIIIISILSLIVAFLKFYFILNKYNKKKIKRILNYNKKLSFSGVFKPKTTIIIILMISIGISLRIIFNISGLYLSPVYLGISIALWLSVIQFITPILKNCK